MKAELSIFEMKYGPKNTHPKDRVFEMIDKLMPRMWAMETLQYWQDDNNSIMVKFDSNNTVLKIVVRFKIDSVEKVFIEKIKDLAKSLDSKITISQKITFDPDQLTEEVIKENDNRFLETGQPLNFLKNQKKIELG